MSFSLDLLRWYRKNGRHLPWRGTRDPYKILVSEIMLQQTQVPRVLLFYKKWLKLFPGWSDLARATNAEVIHAWAGLGYNRRALVLRDIAKQIVQHGVPETQTAWLALKGIGPYTSAAMATFSLHQRALPIDTNIRRVLGRWLLGHPFPQPKIDAQLPKRADDILPTRGQFYLVPQAIFDLATSICTKRPSCAVCPLRSSCKAAPKFLQGNVRVPKQMIKKAKETTHRNKKYPDRIYRGRILKIVRELAGVSINTLGKRIDTTFNRHDDQPWLLRMIDRMKKDGMIEEQKKKLFLQSK